jgi:hydrogenase maturation factor HypF (carbamoyltransferase family)
VNKILIKNNFQVYSQSAVPTNDGGIALGQMAIAAKRRAIGCV